MSKIIIKEAFQSKAVISSPLINYNGVYIPQEDLIALTVGKLIDSDGDFIINILEVTQNNSLLDVTFDQVSSLDEDLILTLNEDKTNLTIQTDEISNRFSNVEFTATNGEVSSSSNIVAYVSINPENEFLLNLYTNNAAAFSLSQRKDTSVNAITVRRTLDGLHRDIGFIDRELDLATLIDFVGSGDGYVSKWHDQGGTNHATQTDDLKQPKIVDSGSVITKNGKPFLNFEGDNIHLNLTNAIRFETSSLFCLYQNTVKNIVNYITANGLSGASFEGILTGGTVSGVTGMGLISNGTYKVGTIGNNLNMNLGFWKGDGIANYGFGVNGSVEEISPFGSGFDVISIGRDSSAVNFEGYMSDFILFDGNLTSDRATIEGIINSNTEDE